MFEDNLEFAGPNSETLGRFLRIPALAVCALHVLLALPWLGNTKLWLGRDGRQIRP